MNVTIESILTYIGYIFTVCSIIWLLTPRKYKRVIKPIKSQITFRDFLLILIVTIFALIAPAFLVYESLKSFTGLLFWVTQILSWFIICNFLVFLYVFLEMGQYVAFFKKPKKH